MALKLSVDKLDDVEENLRSLYVEKDGKFSLAVDGIEDTSALKEALRKERKRADDAEKQRKAWEKSGKTPDEIQELIEAQEQRALTEAERKGEWDKLRGQMNEKHAKDLQTKDETIGQMRKRLEAELIDAKAVAEVAAQGGNPKLLLPHVRQHVKVDEDFNVVVVDAKGVPRVDGKGDPLTISALIAEMKAADDFGQAFKGSEHSGSGTRPNNGGGNLPNTPAGVPKSWTEAKTAEEKAAFIKHKNQKASAG